MEPECFGTQQLFEQRTSSFHWRGVVRIEWYLFEADQGIVGRDGLRYSVEKGWYLSGYGGFFWSDGLTWK